MLFVCQILNISNYEALFDQKVHVSLAIIIQVWKITVFYDLFHHVFFSFYFFFAIADLKNFIWCNVIQQIKRVLPNNN